MACEKPRTNEPDPCLNHVLTIGHPASEIKIFHLPKLPFSVLQLQSNKKAPLGTDLILTWSGVLMIASVVSHSCRSRSDGRDGENVEKE